MEQIAKRFKFEPMPTGFSVHLQQIFMSWIYRSEIHCCNIDDQMKGSQDNACKIECQHFFVYKYVGIIGGMSVNITP